MAKHICGDSISESWLQAVDYLLHQNKLESFNLLVEITNPLNENANMKDNLNRVMLNHGMQSIETVANTIFPNELYKNSNSKDDFFRKYQRVFPKVKRSPDGNRKDTYFNRLTNWPLVNQQPFNQVDEIIKKLRRQLELSNPKRVVYEALVTHPYLEASVYEPLIDHKKITGFPCLSFLSFKLEDHKLNLTAVYRNHFFIERAYGNYLGLSRLQNFISTEAGCPIGNLCVLSTHAEIDRGPSKPSISCIEDFVSKYLNS